MNDYTLRGQITKENEKEITCKMKPYMLIKFKLHTKAVCGKDCEKDVEILNNEPLNRI